MVDLANPATDPMKLPLKEKIQLYIETDGFLNLIENENFEALKPESASELLEIIASKILNDPTNILGWKLATTIIKLNQVLGNII